MRAPDFEVLDQLLLHSAHVETRAAESKCRERHIGDELSCVLQDSNHLNIAVNDPSFILTCSFLH